MSRRVLAVTAYAVVLLAWCAVIGIPNDPIGVALWLWLLAICWRLDWSLQFPKDWWPWLLALVVYAFIRGITDDIGFAPHEVWPIRADEWLARLWGGDEVPTVSLQRRLCGDPCDTDGPVGWYDLGVSATYASHFLAGLTIAGILWIRDRREFLRWIRRYVTISYLALVGYIVYPMAPPWMAARDGLLPPLARISSRGFHHLGIERTTMVLGALPNQTAAMPSLHTGFTYLIAFYAISRLTAWWRWLVLLYPAAMTFTLVYSGEHYLVDTLMGAVIALLAMLIGAWWDRWRPPERVLSPG
ncbi:MAG TPA: phosphatase PAP2 family protein [Nocardioides sp.]|uniref:phosphatase PAP2 family protein n=1 Tax=Nocardioides sp. TaxID=35761 RepID=UPI002E30FDBF|nr:phosphatase PAP2 family protein [Nocardioides sp.]HEX5086329.1 phosphatase PAP2 family protein [Nocardioides sp.]